jgi:BlaI family penicillinase repressor
MSAKKNMGDLSRRERQIMEIVFQRGQATVQEVLDDLPDPPSYSAVRAMLRILEEKGYVQHKKRGPRYVFHSTMTRSTAKRSALRHVVQTFFDGSVESTVAALIDVSGSQLTDEEFERLATVIEQARKKGEGK